MNRPAAKKHTCLPLCGWFQNLSSKPDWRNALKAYKVLKMSYESNPTLNSVSNNGGGMMRSLQLSILWMKRGCSFGEKHSFHAKERFFKFSITILNLKIWSILHGILHACSFVYDKVCDILRSRPVFTIERQNGFPFGGSAPSGTLENMGGEILFPRRAWYNFYMQVVLLNASIAFLEHFSWLCWWSQNSMMTLINKVAFETIAGTIMTSLAHTWSVGSYKGKEIQSILWYISSDLCQNMGVGHNWKPATRGGHAIPSSLGYHVYEASFTISWMSMPPMLVVMRRLSVNGVGHFSRLLLLWITW